jgi:RNA polymerase sigma factor (sigma-70 family)
MASNLTSKALQPLFRAALLSDGPGPSDGELLEAFVTRRDGTYFEALVRRHGSMVLGVCRRILRNPHDAEDAFQAVFLVLAQRASTVVPRELVGNWLYGVAYRTALAARRATARWRAREAQGHDMPEPKVEADETWRELLPLLDRELNRLPAKYRAPVVLCHLEGRTRQEAARQLGLPVGTVSGRLTTALRLLAKRLRRQGLALSIGALAAALSPETGSASVPASLIAATAKARPLLAAGQAAGLVSTNVAALTQGVLKSMLLAKLKLTATLLAVVLIVAGTGTLAYQMQAAPVPQKKEAEHPSGPRAEDRLRDLAQVRVRAAAKAYEALWQAYKDGHADEEEVYRWSVRLLTAQRETSVNKAQRVAAFEKHLKRMKDLELLAPTRVRKPGVPVPPEKVPITEYYRSEAELWLHQARRDR